MKQPNKLKKQYKCKRVKFIDILKNTKNIQETLEVTNTDYNTFVEWCENYEWFKDAIEYYDRSMVYFVEHKLIEMIKDGNLKAIEVFMRYRNAFKKIENEEEDGKMMVKGEVYFKMDCNAEEEAFINK